MERRLIRCTRHRARGSVLLFALFALLVLAIGALFTMRGVFNDTSLTDAFSQRTKNIQVSDLALQWVSTQIASAGGPLEIAATSQPWYLNAQPGQSISPTASYWQTCISKPTAASTCVSVPLPAAAPQQAWAFVQPTGRVDAYACGIQGMTALYYDIWIHTVDPRTQSATDTESVYKLCTAS